MYIYLTGNKVSEIIPDIDPVFPGVHISRRYAPDFVAKLLHVPDDTQVEPNDVYDPETGTFDKPPAPEPGEWTEPEPGPELGPSQLDRVEAQATYTAMMTDTLLEV